jgi:hypothetical protein
MAEITHKTSLQELAGGVVVGDRDDQCLGGTGLPDEIALEIGQHHVAAVDPIQQIKQGLGVGVFVDGHAPMPSFSKKAQATR